jgi:alpha-1,3-rhamnosyltransferase
LQPQRPEQLDRSPVQETSVSVVVPSYNHAKFIESCLRSIFGQTLQPSKLLVIDDGSKDDSTRVIESVLRDCPFACELIARENRGLSATLNQALSLMDGHYFAYLGSDDMWLADFLAARVKLLESRPSAVLGYGHTYFIDEKNKVVDCTAEWADYKDGDVRQMLLQTIGPMSSTVLYVRKFLARHGWNTEARLEDYELYLRLSLDGEFAFDPGVRSAWRQHEKNASRNQGMMLDEHVSALQRVAPSFGIQQPELDKLIKIIRFNRAEDFLRIGDKRKAAQLFFDNLSGLQASRLLPMMGRFLLPYSAVSWMRKRKKTAAMRSYGPLE